MQASSPLPPLSPRTKWLIALCLCVLVMLLEFLTYHMAYFPDFFYQVRIFHIT